MERETRPSHRHRVIAIVLVVVGSLSLTIGLTVNWAQRTVFRSGEFADRATSSLDSAVVRSALSEQIADQLIENGASDLASYRSALVGIVDSVLASSGFRGIFRNAVEQAHHAVFQRNGAVVLLQLGETLKLISANADKANASVAVGLPSAAGSLLINVTPTVRRLKLWRFADNAHWFDEACLTIAVLAYTSAVAVDRRRRVVSMIGTGVAASGVFIVLMTRIAPSLIVRTVTDPAQARAIVAVAQRFVSNLRTTGLYAIPLGVLLVAATDASERPDLAPMAERVRRAVRYRPRTRAAQIFVGTVMVLAGFIAVFLRDRIVSLAVLIGGAALLYFGAVLVIRATLGPVPEASIEPRTTIERRVLAIAAAIIVVALSTSALVVGIGTSQSTEHHRGVLRCNGSADLCDRRLDQVAFAASHNSMSAESDPGWLFAENVYGIPAQLEYGVRALLVKTHYGIDTGVKLAGAPLVVTDRSAEIANDPDAEADELGKGAVQTVQRFDRQVGPVAGKPQIYLCHGYCELGATKFSDTLTAIRRFMDRNPDDVLIMIIGNYVSAADTATAFQHAGLVNRLWTYDATRPPPTLRQMIEARRTLLVLAERNGGSPPWYGPAYGKNAIVQDTPFTFAKPSDFSCAPNRGEPSSPLFQINHWITNTKPPSPSEARSVNSYDSLMASVTQCERERNHFPTIVGVNFYNKGDLLGVVDKLNQRTPG